MKRLYLQFSLIVILIVLLIVPSAFFVNMIAHEFYHVYKHAPYSENICFDLTKPDKAYTVVSYPDLKIKYNYSSKSELEEEIMANNYGRLFSFLYILIIGLIATAFLISIKKQEK